MQICELAQEIPTSKTPKLVCCVVLPGLLGWHLQIPLAISAIVKSRSHVDYGVRARPILSHILLPFPCLPDILRSALM